jgi:hypothetical protein
MKLARPFKMPRSIKLELGKSTIDIDQNHRCLGRSRWLPTALDLQRRSLSNR